MVGTIKPLSFSLFPFYRFRESHSIFRNIMDSQLWVPVPKIQSSKSEEKQPASKQNPVQQKESQTARQSVQNSGSSEAEKRPAPAQPPVNISKVLHHQEKFSLGIKINKKRTLDDLLDDDEDESPALSAATSHEKSSMSLDDSASESKESRPVAVSKPDGPAEPDRPDKHEPASPRPTTARDHEHTSDHTHSSHTEKPDTHAPGGHSDKHAADEGVHHEPKRHKPDSGTDDKDHKEKHTGIPEKPPSTHRSDESSKSDTLEENLKTKLDSLTSARKADTETGKSEEKAAKPRKTKEAAPAKEVPVKKEVAFAPDTPKEPKREIGKEAKKEPSGRREKKVDPSVIEDTIEPINRWWEDIDDDMDYNKGLELESKSTHWKYLEHNGMIFTPEYVPHNVPVKLKGELLNLPPHIEEVATMWAQSIGTNYETSEIYCKNFWGVFTAKFDKEHPIRKSKLSDVDFTAIKEHLEQEKLKKKENKEFYKAKQQEDALREYRFNYALVDWIREKVSSNRLEPPGLFKGRGLHPKQGLLKLRMFPKDVILNVSKDAPVPKVDFQRPGHCWKDIYHDNSVTWLAYYKDSINDQYKYMYLSAQSKFKGFHDFLKYNKARELKSYIQKIRDDYNTKMLSLDMYERQIGTAIYLIDFLALRVGGEKDADEADTVGCCSLRVEHIKFNENKQNTITLDFLGKDSIRYYNTLNDVAYDNLVKFCNRKKPNAEIFNLINTSKLNDYLKELMDGLSAKVFRTYNASITLQNQFKRLRSKYRKNFTNLSLVKSENFTDTFNGADGAEAKEDPDTARTTSSHSSANTDLTNMTAASIDINNIDDLDNESDNEDQNGDQVKPEDDPGQEAAPVKEEPGAKKKKAPKPKDREKEVAVDLGNVSELLQFYNYANREVAILCNHQRSVPKQHETSMSKLKLQADMLKEDIQELNEYLKHLQSNAKGDFSFTSKTKDANGNPRKLLTKPGMKLEAAKNKLAALKKKQKDHVIKMRIKDSNKTVALGTSKINYMDPRITVAFCKRYEIPIEKVFNKSLRMKFPWAMYVKSDFTF